MVGEVLSVIRSLAKEGITMMIVTHEMKFAHDMSNRVFYMDEGGIYEEGTPQQIFENPTKEKTRIFIRRLKQLSLEITSSHFDFIGFISRIEQFGRDNIIDARIVRNMQLSFEELVIQNIVGRLDQNSGGFPLNIAIEYSETDSSAEMTISYGGAKFDPFTDGDELSMMIVEKLTESFAYSHDDENRITVRFAE